MKTEAEAPGKLMGFEEGQRRDSKWTKQQQICDLTHAHLSLELHHLVYAFFAPKWRWVGFSSSSLHKIF